jgi:hypothetical protein
MPKRDFFSINRDITDLESRQFDCTSTEFSLPRAGAGLLKTKPSHSQQSLIGKMPQDDIEIKKLA